MLEQFQQQLSQHMMAMHGVDGPRGLTGLPGPEGPHGEPGLKGELGDMGASVSDEIKIKGLSGRNDTVPGVVMMFLSHLYWARSFLFSCFLFVMKRTNT